ncbi:hypothetical protein V8C86DRAFT_1809506 [Haematococcus lacustris]
MSMKAACNASTRPTQSAPGHVILRQAPSCPRLPATPYKALRCSTVTRAQEPQQEPQKSAPSSEDQKPLILQSGQGTAILTGGISILFGVAYLALVFFMDSRGGEMLPPPPEAFGP